MKDSNPILLISGTPASGKDTITKHLVESSNRFIHFRKHKTGDEGKLDDSYILVSKQEFDRLAAAGEFVQYHYRYGRGYGVSKDELAKCLNSDKVPIIHVGRYDNIFSFLGKCDWKIFSVLILTSRSETLTRLRDRHGSNEAEISARLAAYDEERSQLSTLLLSDEQLQFNILIENSKLDSRDAAKMIEEVLLINDADSISSSFKFNKESCINSSIFNPLPEEATVSLCKAGPQENFVVTDKIFNKFSIYEGRFKTISFINCTFKGKFEARGTKCENISFSNCNFSDDIQIYNLAVESTFDLMRCTVDEDIKLDALKSNKMLIQNSQARNIKITSSGSASTINSITLKQSQLEDNLNISSINVKGNLEIDSIRAFECSLQSLSVSESTQITIKNVQLEDLVIEHIHLNQKNEIHVDESVLSNFYFRGNELNDGSIVLSSLLINGQFVMKGQFPVPSSVDISSVNASKLLLDDSLQKAIRLNEKLSPLLPAPEFLEKRTATFRLLKKMYHDDDQYGYEDRCFYLMKNEETKLKIKSVNKFAKLFLFVTYMTNRYALGWGVKLGNVVFTSVLIAILFSLYYYFALGLTSPLNTITYLDTKLTGVTAALFTSVWSFFGMQADITFMSGRTPNFALVSEFLLGIIMVTVIVGMIIRKLVR